MSATRIGLRLSLVSTLALLAACDPCAGLTQCKTSSQLHYYGRVEERETGRSASGVRVSYVRRGGEEMYPDSIADVSDADGWFELDANVPRDGLVFGDFVIEPPGRPPYTVRWYPLQTRRRAGDGGDLGRLVLQPYFIFIGDVQDTGKRPLADARVTYRQVGGVPATPVDTVLVTDVEGKLVIVFRADAYGVIEGEFTIEPADGRPARVIPVKIHTSHTIHVPYATLLAY